MNADEAASTKELHELLAVPLLIDDAPCGVICLHAPQPDSFTIVHMSLMKQLGQYTSNLIVQSRRHHERLSMSALAELGNLAGRVAHEMNAPLDIILKKAERLLKHKNNEEQKQRLEDIMKEARRGGAIVADLLDYHRRLHTDEKMCDMTAAVSNAWQLIRHSFEHEGIQIHENLDPNLPRVTIGEAGVKQIFFNLARNAVDAMPGGGELTVQTRRAEDGQHVELLIRDTGVGIAPDILDKIFHPYFTTKEPGQGTGTGLGLTVCQTIVRQHGGTITFESQVGQGSTFVVTLPVEGREVHGSDHSS